MDVFDVVLLGRRPYITWSVSETERDIVSKTISKMGLSDLAFRRFDRLSGGEKQRICIARALAAEPDLIICDEVTSALDQLVAEGILELLQNLQNQLGVSYLFITHDLATVKAIADSIVVMYQGRVVEQGPKVEILSPPHEAYTELLLSSVPEMNPDWLDTLVERRKRGELPTIESLN